MKSGWKLSAIRRRGSRTRIAACAASERSARSRAKVGSTFIMSAILFIGRRPRPTNPT